MMSVLQRVVKPTTHRTKRLLKNKCPKIIENIKQTLFIRGRKSHDTVSTLLKEVFFLKKPHGVLLNKKHDILPFEDMVPIEKLCQKYDTSLFVFASHNKKRPNNLVIGRMFDRHLLDVFELGIDSLKSLSDFKHIYPKIGIKPALIFLGEEFETVHALKRLKNLFIDMLHQQECDRIHMNNIEYVITFAFVDNKILLRTYKITLKNAGEKGARVDLEPIGPFADFSMRRKILSSNDLYKKACTKPKTKGKKIKNIKRDVFGTKLGRVHMTSQDVNKLQTRKMKGLRKPKKTSDPKNKR